MTKNDSDSTQERLSQDYISGQKLSTDHDEITNRNFISKKHLVLSPPVALSDIKKHVPYIVRRTLGNKATNDVWCLSPKLLAYDMYWAQIKGYSDSLYPSRVYVNGDNISGVPTPLSIYVTPAEEYQLRTNKDMYLRWAPKNINNDTPLAEIRTEPSTAGDGSFYLKTLFAGNEYYVTDNVKTPDYLNLTNSKPATSYSFHKIYLPKGQLSKAFQAVPDWNDATFFPGSSYYTDHYYETIADEQMGEIYKEMKAWGVKYQENIFDCDDFAFVYKAFASYHAYKSKPSWAYAVGLIMAKTSDSGHAAIVFVTQAGEIKIFEPQTGQIFTPANWKNNGEVWKPTMILM